MKIRLKQFYEVIRLEIIEGDSKLIKDIVYSVDEIAFYAVLENNIINILMTDNIIDIAIEMEQKIKLKVEEYNNTIKDDDGYEWICKNCGEHVCKVSTDVKELDQVCIGEGVDTYGTDWQKITNKEIIEIIEDD